QCHQLPREGEGAAYQGGTHDDGPHRRGAHGLLGVPLRVSLLLHVPSHGSGLRGYPFRVQRPGPGVLVLLPVL
ncbi:unnamed protein product, partial [Ectocarpus sp. 4 AP-2014]